MAFLVTNAALLYKRTCQMHRQQGAMLAIDSWSVQLMFLLVCWLLRFMLDVGYWLVEFILELRHEICDSCRVIGQAFGGWLGRLVLQVRLAIFMARRFLRRRENMPEMWTESYTFFVIDMAHEINDRIERGHLPFTWKANQIVYDYGVNNVPALCYEWMDHAERMARLLRGGLSPSEQKSKLRDYKTVVRGMAKLRIDRMRRKTGYSEEEWAVWLASMNSLRMNHLLKWGEYIYAGSPDVDAIAFGT